VPRLPRHRSAIVRALGATLVLSGAAAFIVADRSGRIAPEFGAEQVLPASAPADAQGSASGPTSTPAPAPATDAAPSPFTTTAPRGPVDMGTWPTRVSIAALDIAAPVKAVGVGSAGELIVPASPMDVGWYQGGAVPGEPGVALLTSHVDTRREGRGVFAGLVELRPGDSVLLEAADGTLQRWTVVARTQHRKDELPPELFARSGVAKLALVTCGGPFDRERRSYRDNVIVWAEPTP
jgi:hypothetical protein